MTQYLTGALNAVQPLAGTELLFADNGGAQGERISVAQIVGFGTIKAQLYGTSALAAAGTLTAANVTGATDTVYLAMTGTFVAAVNIQLPTAAAIIAAATNLTVGSTYILRIINPGATYVLTITTNTGITLTGTTTLATTSFRDFLVTITSATTVTVQDVGAGAATE